MATMKDALESLSDPSIRHIVPVSGGKDSAALAIYMRQNYPQIPAEYVFSDTEAELPETYDFLVKLGSFLGKDIHRITALDYMKNVKKKPGREVFDFMLRELYGGYLPSPQARWCTINMKIKPFEQYVGSGTVYSYIGIRGDENREGYSSGKKPPKLSDKPNIIPVYPFKEDDITIHEVKEILNNSGIGYPEYYEWRSRSGCYFCFYQQIGEWQGLKEHHPELFEKAKKYEKTKGSKKFTWVQGRSLLELEKLKERFAVADMDETEGCAICHL